MKRIPGLDWRWLLVLVSAAGPAWAQQPAVIPEDTPLVIGPGTQGFIAYSGPDDADSFWKCFDDEDVPVGEVAEEVHMRQPGDLASFTFRYYTSGGPPTGGSVTAIVRIYANDANDSITPPAGLIATYTIPGLPHSATGLSFEHTFDVPTPVAVPKDLWFGLELVLPPGSVGSLAGAGFLSDSPAVRYGNSHNLTWFGPSGCVAAPGELVDNSNVPNGGSFFVNYHVVIRVFPADDCDFPIANGDFETGTLASWDSIGSTKALTGFAVGTPPPCGAFQGGVSSGATGPFGPSSITVGPLEAFLGVSSGSLNALTPPNAVTVGSAIRQTISVAAGDTLSFDWNFLTDEPVLVEDEPGVLVPNPFRDFCFVTIGSEATMLADMDSTALTEGSQTAFDRETGLQSFARTFTAPAMVTIGLGAVNQLNTLFDSALLIDCVEVTPGTTDNQPPLCNVDLTQAHIAGFLEVAPGSFVVTEGETLIVVFNGTDPDGDLLMVDAIGIPPGATLAPTTGIAPLASTLTWETSASDKAGAPYVMTVTFTDPGGASSSCQVTVADVNLRPVCMASSQTVECTGPGGALVMLDGAATDPDDPPSALAFQWFVSDADVVLDDPSSATPTGTFPIGVTMATLTVTDGRGGVDVCDVLITVQDTTPPEVMCSTNVAVLWPPNHCMRKVKVVVQATEACAQPGQMLPLTVTVRSDEPDNAPGGGDGNTTGDVNGQNGFSSPVDITSSFTFDPLSGKWKGHVFLRAERQGSGDGRKYTIDASVSDCSGNVATSSCCVVVPHNNCHP